jgi:hypothetical protein
MGKYGKISQATDNSVWRMQFACWITKAIDTHSECVILLPFHGYIGYANASECDVYKQIACNVSSPHSSDQGRTYFPKV